MEQQKCYVVNARKFGFEGGDQRRIDRSPTPQWPRASWHLNVSCCLCCNPSSPVWKVDHRSNRACSLGGHNLENIPAGRSARISPRRTTQGRVRTCHPRATDSTGRAEDACGSTVMNKPTSAGPATRVILAVLGQVGLVRAERVGYRRIAGLDDGQAGALPLCPVQRVRPVLRTVEVWAAWFVRRADRIMYPETDVVRRWALAVEAAVRNQLGGVKELPAWYRHL